MIWSIAMAVQILAIKPITLGPGWKATRAWLTGGPVVLIQAKSRTGQIVKSRFDMQKSMFIDPLPMKMEEANIQHLVEALNAATDAPG
jgi:hypothetical protein